MKQSQILAMRARQRAERHRRFDGYKIADIANMADDELGQYIAWLDNEMLTANGGRYAYLDLLVDMAEEESSSRGLTELPDRR